MSPSLMAYCTFINPLTPSASASFFDWTASSAIVASDSECGGSEQALSPEWMPASSMCSMIPQTKTSVPSASASTSTSMASDRYESISTGDLPDTTTASVM